MTHETKEEREATSHASNGDYPLYANRSDTLTAASGRPLRDLSLQKTLTEDISSEDYSISAETLRAQAEIARDARLPATGAEPGTGFRIDRRPQRDTSGDVRNAAARTLQF